MCQFNFQIKTTSPDKFRVRPSIGIVPANGPKHIYVTLQSEQQANASLIKDKFLIMSTDLRTEQIDATETEIAELWKVYFVIFDLFILFTCISCIVTQCIWPQMTFDFEPNI